jgi:hypothetical protein
MTRNTLISVIILGAIVIYFAVQMQRPAEQDSQAAPQPAPGVVQPAQAPTKTPPVPLEEKAVLPICSGQITFAARSLAEVRFAYEGTAETAWARWPGGELKARVEDACSGAECRMVLPQPALTPVQVGLDACEGTELP